MASYWQSLAQQSDQYLSLLAAGVALGELQKNESAEAMLTGAIAMNPHTVIAYVRRATARREQSKIVLAMADVEEAKKRDPELALALLRRADEYRGNFQLDKALADYSDAIRLDPQATAYFGRGITYAFQGDLDKALADASEAIRLEPGNGDWCGKRGSIYFDMREFEKAAADFDRTAELTPIRRYYYKLRAVAYFRSKHFDQALESIAKAVELWPNDLSYLTWIPPEAAKCPEQRFRTGLLELADRTIELTGKSASAYAVRARILAAFGQQQQALADLQTALDGIPAEDQLDELGLSATCDELGQLCDELAHPEEPIPYLVKMTERQPKSAKPWYRCVLAQLAAARTNAYQATCRTMIGQFSDGTVPADGNLIAWACALAPDALSDWAPAIALAEKASQSDPQSASYWNTWGAMLYRAGRFDEALACLSKAEALVQTPGKANGLSPADVGFFLAMAAAPPRTCQRGEAVAGQVRGLDRQDLCRGRPRHRGPFLEPATNAQALARRNCRRGPSPAQHLPSGSFCAPRAMVFWVLDFRFLDFRF